MNLDELINEIRKSNKVTFLIGSTTVTTKTSEDEEYLNTLFDNLLRHNYFDSEFYYNWIDRDERDEYDKLYEEKIRSKLIKNLDMVRFIGGMVEININMDYQTTIDEHFLTYRDVMSPTLFNRYREYRLEYAGIDITK